jgi:hypothetical protein
MANSCTWYKDEATYLRFKEICTDKESFYRTYSEWVQFAQKQIDEAEKCGIIIAKIHVDPEMFLAWCKVNGRVPGKQARGEYLMIFQREYVGQTH